MGIVSLLPGMRNLPGQLSINDQPVHRGGEGTIYFTTDGQYAVKFYHNPSEDKARLLQLVVDLGRNLGEEERFLAWPLGVVAQLNGQLKVGVVTRRVPASYVPLYKLIYSPQDAASQFVQGRSWLDYIKIARGTAAAVRTIHGKGMAHADIHLKNFLVNPVTGVAILIDLDGLVVKGFLPPQVKGMPGFIAPEVMLGMSRPDELTDRYSLAVLVLWILLLRNVMLSQRCYDDEDPARDDMLSYGEYACFSENPNDQRNYLRTIGTPLFRCGALSYRTLTPRLQELTNRALIAGLHDPPLRPQAVEWEKALADAYDAVVTCFVCRQTYLYPYWQPPVRRLCPFCGAQPHQPLPSVVELLEQRAGGIHVPVRSLVLYQGSSLPLDVLEGGQTAPFTRRDLPVAGQIIWDPREHIHRLINSGDQAWTILSGGSGSVPRGTSLPLRPDTLFSFGPARRMARVLE